MTYLANEPAAWMPLMGVVAFVTVHGALLLMLLRLS